MGILEIIAKSFLQEAVVIEKHKLSASAYQLKIKGDSIKRTEFESNHFLRIGIGMSRDTIPIKDFIRSYSIWNFDKLKGTLDVAIATHSNGSGSKWVEEIETGDKLHYALRKNKFSVDNSADSYLLIGDLSALANLYVIKRYLTKDKQVESILYSQHKDDLFPDIDHKTPFSFYELPQNPTDEVIHKIQEIVATMKGKKMVYIAGDSRLCVALTTYFRCELNWDSKQIKTKPFWNPLKKGLE